MLCQNICIFFSCVCFCNECNKGPSHHKYVGFEGFLILLLTHFIEMYAFKAVIANVLNYSVMYIVSFVSLRLKSKMKVKLINILIRLYCNHVTFILYTYFNFDGVQIFLLLSGILRPSSRRTEVTQQVFCCWFP